MTEIVLYDNRFLYPTVKDQIEDFEIFEYLDTKFILPNHDIEYKKNDEITGFLIVPDDTIDGFINHVIAYSVIWRDEELMKEMQIKYTKFRMEEGHWDRAIFERNFPELEYIWGEKFS